MYKFFIEKKMDIKLSPKITKLHPFPLMLKWARIIVALSLKFIPTKFNMGVHQHVVIGRLEVRKCRGIGRGFGDNWRRWRNGRSSR